MRAFFQRRCEFFLCPKTLGQNWLGTMLAIFIVTGPSLMHKPHIQLSHHVRDPEFSLWCQRLKSKVAPRATLTGVSLMILNWSYFSFPTFPPSLFFSFCFLSTALEYFLYFFWWSEMLYKVHFFFLSGILLHCSKRISQNMG